MTRAKHSTAASLLKSSTALALASLLGFLPVMAQAATLCEKGRITVLEHSGGGGSVVLVATDKSPAANWQRYRTAANSSKYATQIWQASSDTRWRDRLSLLRTAYALQQPIVISSSDGNCMGPMDEFTISLCQPGDSICM